ncbi:hypothetical protein J6590_031999 [Homalodisca vitripennis]|nr:hypothetical protein J6590_031999 [Homalodisca vitripennis]
MAVMRSLLDSVYNHPFVDDLFEEHVKDGFACTAPYLAKRPLNCLSRSLIQVSVYLLQKRFRPLYWLNLTHLHSWNWDFPCVKPQSLCNHCKTEEARVSGGLELGGQTVIVSSISGDQMRSRWHSVYLSFARGDNDLIVVFRPTGPWVIRLCCRSSRVR